MKAYHFLYLLSVSVVPVFTGCRAYQGYRIYENENVRQENSAVLSKQYNLNFQNTVKIEKVEHISYDEVVKKEMVEENLYSDPTASGVTAKFIAYPIVMVLSPLYLLAEESETVSFQEHQYNYSYWRKIFNTLSPFISSSKEKAVEKNIIDSSITRHKKEETNNVTVYTAFPVETSHGIVYVQPDSELVDAGKAIFDNLLPEKMETIYWNSRKQKMELKSSDFLSSDVLEKWNMIQKLKDPGKIYENYPDLSMTLENLAKSGIISMQTYETEFSKLKTFVEKWRAMEEERKAEEQRIAENIRQKKALQLLRIFVTKQNLDEQFEVADEIRRTGMEFKDDFYRANEAIFDNLDAQAFLVLYHKKVISGNIFRQYSNSLEIKKKKQIDEVQSLALKGNLTAQFMLGEFRYNEKNYQEALKWYRISAEGGYCDGEYKYGFCKAMGKGCQVDLPEAEKWLKKAKDQGNTNASYFLSICHFSKCLKKIIDMKFEQATFDELKSALKEINVAAEQGNMDALITFQNLNIAIGILQMIPATAPYFQYVAGGFKDALKWYSRILELNMPGYKENVSDKIEGYKQKALNMKDSAIDKVKIWWNGL